MRQLHARSPQDSSCLKHLEIALGATATARTDLGLCCGVMLIFDHLTSGSLGYPWNQNQISCAKLCICLKIRRALLVGDSDGSHNISALTFLVQNDRGRAQVWPDVVPLQDSGEERIPCWSS